jgi:hypothetical protein
MFHPSLSSFLSSCHLHRESLGKFEIINFMGFAHHLMFKKNSFQPLDLEAENSQLANMSRI